MATDIGIDLGSSKTVIFSSSKIVLEQPSAVTVDADTWQPVYFGEKAKQTMGRTPESLTCVLPIQNGVIADYDSTEAMLSNYMNSVFGKRIVRPRVVATLPTNVTELQHHSLAKAVEASGGRNVTVIESPLAVAIGLGIDLFAPKGNLIVDMGAGTVDIAAISLGGIAQCDSYKFAGRDIDDEITKYIRKEYNIAVGPLTAERIKNQLATVVENPVEVGLIAKGSNVFTGMPETFEITSTEIYPVIYDAVNHICNAIRKVTERTDPDIVGDIMEHGIYLTGGLSLLKGMPEFLGKYFNTKVHTDSDPTYSVVRGAARALKYPKLLADMDYQFRSIKELIIE